MLPCIGNEGVPNEIMKFIFHSMNVFELPSYEFHVHKIFIKLDCEYFSETILTTLHKFHEKFIAPRPLFLLELYLAF